MRANMNVRPRHLVDEQAKKMRKRRVKRKRQIKRNRQSDKEKRKEREQECKKGETKRDKVKDGVAASLISS